MGNDLIITGILFAMSGIFIVDVVCNFGTLKLYNIIPMPFYLFFPSVSILISVLCPIMMPMVVNIYENVNTLNVKWRQNCIHKDCSVFEMKYLKRKIKSIKVIRVCGGILEYTLYEMNNSTKARFLFEMINYTINAILSIPVNK
jgi:hypothetical protein